MNPLCTLIEGAYNKPYVRLLSVSNKRGVITAKIELDVQTATGVRRQEVSVQDGDNLEQTAKRAMYADCRVGEIRVDKGKELMELRVPGGEHFLRIGQAYGDVDALAVKREMIRRTIKEHLDKEKRQYRKTHLLVPTLCVGTHTFTGALAPQDAGASKKCVLTQSVGARCSPG